MPGSFAWYRSASSSASIAFSALVLVVENPELRHGAVAVNAEQEDGCILCERCLEIAGARLQIVKLYEDSPQPRPGNLSMAMRTAPGQSGVPTSAGASTVRMAASAVSNPSPLHAYVPLTMSSWLSQGWPLPK